MTSKKTTITTRSIDSPQASGPRMKRQIAGIHDSDAREIFLRDHSHLHRKPSIIPGAFDPISEIFSPESPNLDPVAKVKYNMRKYPILNLLSPTKRSLIKKNSQPTQQNSLLASTLQSKILQFRATHLLVGRIKNLIKDPLIADLDILTSTL